MTNYTINVWVPVLKQWARSAFPEDWSFGKCIVYCEEYRAIGIECYVTGDLVGELAAKAGISRAQAEIEYGRPEWAA